MATLIDQYCTYNAYMKSTHSGHVCHSGFNVAVRIDAPTKRHELAAKIARLKFERHNFSDYWSFSHIKKVTFIEERID